MGVTKETRETAAARIERELDEGVSRVVQRAQAEGTIGTRPSAVVTRQVDPATIRPAKPAAPQPTPGRRYPINPPARKPRLDLPVRACDRPRCPERFKPKNARQRFCSTRCRENPAPRGFAEKHCALCGDTFIPTGPRQLYCSDACRDEKSREQKKESKQRTPPETRELDTPAEPPAATPGLESRVAQTLDDGPADFESVRDRYLELLFGIAQARDEDPQVRVDALERLERLSA